MMQEKHRKIRLPQGQQTPSVDPQETFFDYDEAEAAQPSGSAGSAVPYFGVGDDLFSPDAYDASSMDEDASVHLDDAFLPVTPDAPDFSGSEGDLTYERVFLPEVADSEISPRVPYDYAADTARAQQARQRAARERRAAQTGRAVPPPDEEYFTLEVPAPGAPRKDVQAEQRPYRTEQGTQAPRRGRPRNASAATPHVAQSDTAQAGGAPHHAAHTPEHAGKAARRRAAGQNNAEESLPVSPKQKKGKKKKHPILRKFIGLCAVLVLISCTLLAIYLKVATKNDFLWLDLAQLPHREATILYTQAADGTWAEYARLEATQQKQWVDLADVPEDLQHAFVAVEDKNFYKHSGVSITRTVYAVLNEVKHALTGTYFGGENGIKQGASTIDQQLIKNLTYDNDAGGFEGYLRKIREIYRAYKMDADYEKDTIMEAYLNVISFTGNTAGVQAESLKLFSKTVDQLTLEQCASIAAITKNPYRYDPTRNPETHLTRRNYILYEMWQQKYITEEQYNTASAQPIGLEAGPFEVQKTPVTSYFTDKLIKDVSNDLGKAYGLSRAETTNLLYNGGLRIYTTVDANLQDVMERNLLYGAQYFPQPGIPATVQATDAEGNLLVDDAGNPVMEQTTETPQAAMVSIGYDGSLKAVVGGLGEKEISRGFNRGTDAVRQVGSTMKPIGAYALAVEKNRVNWSTALLDAPVRKIEDTATGEKRDWPANFSQTYTSDTMLVADALAQSINTIAVRVGERAGVWSIYNFTRSKLHISSFINADRAAGPMILGSSTYGVTPYELAGAYMMFGNGGSYTTLHSYTDVQTGYGRSILQPDIATQQVLSADTAYVMNRMLKGVMQGAGTGAGYAVSGDMESIGKTGTTSDNRDYWFVGLTPYYVTATWYGYDSGAALNTSLGTHAPTNAWRAVMQQAQSGLAYQEFPTDGTVVSAAYCTESGGLAAAGCPSTRTGYYRAGNLPKQCALHAA